MTEKMEIFKKNLEEANFSQEFVQKAIQYFNELQEEGKIQGLNVEDTLGYYAKVGSFTCNASQSETNLKDLRYDINRLYTFDLNNILNLNDYFSNIEEFELQVLYTLFYEFYPQKEVYEENL